MTSGRHRGASNSVSGFGKRARPYLDDLVAVRARDPGVDEPHGDFLDLPVLFKPRVLQVVRVHNPHHVLELVAPPVTAVVPVQVLRLFEHGDVLVF